MSSADAAKPDLLLIPSWYALEAGGSFCGGVLYTFWISVAVRPFDFIIASIHSNFNLKKADQERRIFKALENPYTTMLGHPTGRLLLSRDGYELDMRNIIDEAARNSVIIELNASPYRLDIDWRNLKYAKEKGVLISINPDAHATGGLYEIFYGIGIARKGWQEKKDILNTRTATEVMEMFKKRK